MTHVISVAQMRAAGAEFVKATTAWCWANGLDPAKISADYAVLVIGDCIQYHEFYLNERGHRVVDLTGPTDLMATLFREAPLVEPMPEQWPTPDPSAIRPPDADLPHPE
jgi:hypothetical protein